MAPGRSITVRLDGPSATDLEWLRSWWIRHAATAGQPFVRIPDPTVAQIVRWALTNARAGAEEADRGDL